MAIYAELQLLFFFFFPNKMIMKQACSNYYTVLLN